MAPSICHPHNPDLHTFRLIRVRVPAADFPAALTIAPDPSQSHVRQLCESDKTRYRELPESANNPEEEVGVRVCARAHMIYHRPPRCHRRRQLNAKRKRNPVE